MERLRSKSIEYLYIAGKMTGGSNFFFYPIEPLKSFIRYIVLDCLSINLITALSLQNKGALTTALSINLITAPSLQNKGALTTAEAGTGGSKSTGPPSMADILKGLNTVKLRTVQR